MGLEYFSKWYLVSGIIFGIINLFVARRKKRDGYSWLLLGIFFNFISSLLLMFLPTLASDSPDQLYWEYNQYTLETYPKKNKFLFYLKVILTTLFTLFLIYMLFWLIHRFVYLAG